MDTQEFLTELDQDITTSENKRDGDNNLLTFKKNLRGVVAGTLSLQLNELEQAKITIASLQGQLDALTNPQ